MRWRVLRLLFLIYVAWAAFAILLVPLSAIGVVATNPLAALLPLVLGLPWSVLLTWWIDSSSAYLNFLLLVLAVAINACILRYMSRRPRPAPEPDEEDEDEAFEEEDEDETDDEVDHATDREHNRHPEHDDEEDWDEPSPPRRNRR
ncbi:hypothetical protein K32_33480 [Kaistia sp. 32K]|uniref:hypothetical protein n=1 Tax=Kaistia sp. 32K TaxID=2795690 RepID=UPI0019157C4F|nr:hypothetical protein [Kaistia sp. 32K]BCP54731.1 hypothetical protein K32_33480 [Kaistia sp. 32K]